MYSVTAESIVKITCEKGFLIGTGFSIKSENGPSLIATCGHVVNKTEFFFVNGLPATVLVNEYSTGLDLAIATVEGLDIPSLPISKNGTPKKVNVFGYSSMGENGQKKEPIFGIEAKYSTTLESQRNIDVVKLYPPEPIASGYSGSPVSCPESNEVVAIVSLQTAGGNNFAIRSSHLLAILSDLGLKVDVGESSMIVDKYSEEVYKKNLGRFESGFKDSLKSFNSQPGVWVEPVLYKNQEANTARNEIDLDSVSPQNIIEKPRDIMVRARRQFGLSSLAHYIVLESWKLESPRFVLYLDCRNIKPYKNKMDKIIRDNVTVFGLGFDDISSVVLDEFTDDIENSGKILDFVSEYFSGKKLMIFMGCSDTPLLSEVSAGPRSREFEVLYLWSLDRGGIRKVVSGYNDERYIGEENRVLDRICTDLEILNIPRTPLNCITLLKISEIEFDDSPINRTEMIQRVLFLLFNLDDIPSYKNRPDLKDTQYVLGYFCKKIILEEKYNFSRIEFLSVLKKYCEDSEIDLETDIIFDVLFKNNIIVLVGESFWFKFSYWIFFFAAQQMHQDSDFCDYVFNSKIYISSPEIIEFYTGIDRRRNNALQLLVSDIREIRLAMKEKVGLPENFNIYDHTYWEPDQNQLEEMKKELNSNMQRSDLPSEIKDRYADRDYNRSKPLDQSVNKILEEFHLLKLMKAVESCSMALRNSDYADRELKHELLSEILLSFEQVANILLVVSPVLWKEGNVTVEGMNFVLDKSFSNDDIEGLNALLQVIPSNIVDWYKDHIYSKKMGPLLFSHAKECGSLSAHNLILLVVSKRPRGWVKSVEDYIASNNKNSFYIMDIFLALKKEYKYSYMSNSALKSLEKLIKMCLVKHQLGIEKPGPKVIGKVNNDVLPERKP